MTAIPIPSVAEPFIRLRAQAHLDKGYIVIAAGGIGQPYVTTDYPSVQRALEVNADALMVAKNGVDGVYTADPQYGPRSAAGTTISASTMRSQRISRVMDPSAFILARDHDLPLHVFDIAQDRRNDRDPQRSDSRNRDLEHPLNCFYGSGPRRKRIATEALLAQEPAGGRPHSGPHLSCTDEFVTDHN